MPDPFSIIGGVGSILTIISSVTRVAKSLQDVRESYQNVALNTTLVASQLSTIRAALEALHAWRVSDTVETEATLQLDKDLGLSLSCCAILITVIDSKLTESGYEAEMGAKQKIRYVWLEDILKDYVSNLEGQVRALQLLLTIFQCRTATEQKQQLANRESRQIIEHVRAETMTLGIGETEMDDAMSILSHDPSVHLDVESILMKSPAYIRVYGGEKPESPRRKKVPGKPPPPPPRRKAAARPTPQPNTLSQTVSTSAETAAVPSAEPASAPPTQGPVFVPSPQKPLPPPPPVESVPLSPPQGPINQDSMSPSEAMADPPTVPPRPKSRTQSSLRRTRAPDQEKPQIHDRDSGWHSESPNQETEVQESSAKLVTDSAPIIQLPTQATPLLEISQSNEGRLRATVAAPMPVVSVAPVPDVSVTSVPNVSIAPLPVVSVAPLPDVSTQSNKSSTSEDPVKVPEVIRASIPVVVERNEKGAKAHQFAEPPAIDTLQTNQVDPATEIPPNLTDSKLQEEKEISIEPAPSLAGFRDQLDMAFEERSPSGAGEEGLGLSFTPSERKDTPPTPDEENVMSYKAEPTFNYEWKFTSNNDHDGASKDNPRRTLSIHSSVDMYDASVHNMPIGDGSRPPSSRSIADQETDENTQNDAVDDGLEARMEGLSVLNHQLAFKSRDGPGDEATPARANVRHVYPSVPLECSNAAATPTEVLESVTTSPSDSLLSPQITMTPSESVSESQATSTSPLSMINSVPTSPTRPPPLPPSTMVPIPPIPSTNSTFFTQAARNSPVETSTISSGRESSVFEASSTISSSERSVDNTALTTQRSISNTAATSMSIDGAGLAREQAQADLRRLQNELSAAKARGDSKAAQNFLQESIQVIKSTYLAASTSSETKKSRSPRLTARASVIRFPSMSGSAKASALGDAAAAGDMARVQSLLESKVNVDARSDNHKTPLMRAAMNGHVECLDILQRRGADEFAVDAKGRTVLHLAVASNQVFAVRWLLNAYSPPRLDQLKHRGSILFKATDSIISRSQKNLREASDAEGSKPLHIAVEINQAALMNTLLVASVHTEAKNNWGRTALHQAIISYRRDAFDALLRAGASINATDARGMSPLHWAAKTGHVDIIGTLLEKGADRYVHDLEGNQPMHQAALVGHILAIETLLSEPKDLKNKTQQGETLLHLACVNKNLELATYLLSNGVEVNAEADPQSSLLNTLATFKCIGTGMTPLHYACCKGDYEMALLLLDHGAWVNAPTAEGATALMMACESEDTNVVNLLISREAKINASMSGTLTTALHISARRGDLETVQQLCRANANSAARNIGGSFGRTPLEEATKFCTDKAKRTAVESYFNTILINKIRNARARGQPGLQPSYETVGRANSANPAHQPPLQQSVSYGGSSVVPPQVMTPMQQAQAQLMYQPLQWAAHTYPQLIERGQSLPQGHMLMQQQQPQQPQWYDPNPLTHVESPPPYQAGPTVSARLASQAPVHRPGDSSGPAYS